MKRSNLILSLLCSLYPLTQFAEEYPALLGNGYNSLKLKHKTSQCVEGIKIDSSLDSSTLDFKKVENSSQVHTDLGFPVLGSIFLKKNDQRADFASTLLRNRYTESGYYLNINVQSTQTSLQNPELIISPENLEEFRDKCGNKYISSITKGAQLHVGFKFKFSESEFKNKFECEGKLDLAGLKSHVHLLSSKVKKNSSISIFFYQKGGDLSEFNKIFNSRNLVSCSLEKFEECEKIITDVVDYGKDILTKSVLNGQGQTISFTTSNYPNLPEVKEEQDIVEKRFKLLDQLDLKEYEKDFLSTIKGSKIREYRDCNEHCIFDLKSKANSNIRTLKNSIVLSFESPAKFRERSNLEDLNLHEIELPEKIENFNFSTEQLIEHAPYLSLTIIPALLIIPQFISCFMIRQNYRERNIH